MLKAMKTLALVGAIALTAAACDETPVGPEQTDPSFVKGGLPQPSLPTIVDIVLLDDGEFDVLQTLVVRSGLAGTLSGNRPFTVFAPTDAAFGALFDFLSVPGATPEDQADNLCPVATGCPDFVVTTVLYHVINGRRYSNSVLSVRQLNTLMGDRLYPEGLVLNVSCDAPYDVSIVATTPGETFDIAAKNGVIHVVDGVLLPKVVCDELL